MRRIIIDETTKGVALGYRQENEYTEVAFILPSDWTGHVECFLLKPYATSAVPLTGLVEEDGMVVVTLTEQNLNTSGRGSLEFMCVMNDVVAKSRVIPVVIHSDIISRQTEDPEEWESWVNQVVQAAADAEQYAGYAQASADSALLSATGAAASAQSASGSASSAGQSAQSAGQSAGSASQSAQSASQSASDASQSASSASGSAGSASQSAQNAAQSAQSASQSAQTAQDAVADIVSMQFYIDGSGHLILERR